MLFVSHPVHGTFVIASQAGTYKRPFVGYLHIQGSMRDALPISGDAHPTSVKYYCRIGQRRKLRSGDWSFTSITTQACLTMKPASPPPIPRQHFCPSRAPGRAVKSIPGRHHLQVLPSQGMFTEQICFSSEDSKRGPLEACLASTARFKVTSFGCSYHQRR